MKVKRPMIEFLVVLVGAGVSLAFCSNLTGYAQTYFIGSLLVENSFILGIAIVLTAGLLYDKPDRHAAFGLIIVVFSADQLLILQSLFTTLPFSALGVAGGVLTLVGCLMALVFRPLTILKPASKGP